MLQNHGAFASHIMKHGEENDILYKLQHGFRKNRSCETQLLEFTDDVSNNLEKGKQTDVLVIDFAKAFDKVCQNLLLHKLHHYGIQGKTNRWIHAFLSGRSQVVATEGFMSDSVSVKSGVPQQRRSQDFCHRHLIYRIRFSGGG